MQSLYTGTQLWYYTGLSKLTTAKAGILVRKLMPVNSVADADDLN